jgi:chromosome segregation ATPase
MPFKIRLKNFQSIDSAEIEVNGFTTIIGPNNTGKSAVLRAFNHVFFRDHDDQSFIKNGKDEAEIEITFDDSHRKDEAHQSSHLKPTKKVLYTIKKSKQKLKSSYEVNDSPLQLTPRKVPEEFKLDQEDIKIYELEFPILASLTFYLKPQIAEQFDQKYLLDQDPRLIASVLGNAKQVSILHESKYQVDEDQKKITTQLNANRQMLETFKNQADQLEFSQFNTQLQEIELSQNQINQTEQDIKTLEDLIKIYQNQSIAIQSLANEIKILEENHHTQTHHSSPLAQGDICPTCQQIVELKGTNK